MRQCQNRLYLKLGGAEKSHIWETLRLFLIALLSKGDLYDLIREELDVRETLTTSLIALLSKGDLYDVIREE